MSITKKGVTVFDDDFEVTYEEDIPFTYSFDTKPMSESVVDETVVMEPSTLRTAPERMHDKPPRKSSSVSAQSLYAGSCEDDYDEDNDFYDNEYYDENINDREYIQSDIYDDDGYDYSKSPSRKRAKRKTSIGGGKFLSPVKKTAKYGTKAIYRVARSVVRVVSILITAGTLGVLAYNFWRGAAPYGDPLKILTDRNYALVAYAAVAAIFLIFEFISFLWSMTRMRIREGRKVYKEDTGRGLFSFIFIYIASYLSFLLCSFLPETLGTYEVLNGAKGALDVFGSLHNVLLGLCLAGVISCLVRRHMN